MMENTERRRYGSSVEEILRKDRSDSSIFNDYIEKSEIGKNIFKELHKRLRKNDRVKIGEVKKGFILEEGSKEIGILSQCQSLQTLVSLASEFGLSFVKDDIIPGQSGTIRQIMDAVIEDVIDRVKNVKEDGTVSYIFDASPYDTEHYTEEYSNIDAITWVITSFFLILKYHATIGEVCKWEDQMVDMIKYGLRYINDAFINRDVQDGDDEKGGLATGWNFTKKCKEPSLYFTFTVCECYLDMYSTFESVLKHLHAVDNEKEYGVSVNEEDKEKFEINLEEYKRDYNKKVKPLKARFSPENEIARLYRRINDIGDFEELRIQGTLYGEFNQNCKCVARKVWGFVRNNLADSFFYNDLQKTVTEEDIRMSTTSDVLFNTVYIINIMICAGLDETIRLEGQSAELKGDFVEAKELQLDYDNLLESCLLAVQKAFRTYEKLKNIGKDYIVDQFLVGFNEDFEGHEVAINELRKLRMRIFSLLPLLIHTNNVASEYLVKYPHYNMKKYLEYILDNRYTKDGETYWIWETDGFFCGSNYYYVLALSEYFSYHEKYEKTFIKIGENNAVRENEIKEKYLKELEKPENEIGKREAIIEEKERELQEKQEEKDREIAEKEKEIAALKKEIDSIETPIEDSVRKVVEEELSVKFDDLLSERFATLVSKTFETASSVISGETEETDKTYTAVNEALRNMMISAIVKPFAEAPGRNMDANEYNAFKAKLEKDISAIILNYLGMVRSAEDGKKSALYTFIDTKI